MISIGEVRGNFKSWIAYLPYLLVSVGDKPSGISVCEQWWKEFEQVLEEAFKPLWQGGGVFI